MSRREVAYRFALSVGSLLAGLLLAEGALRLLGLPRIHRPRNHPPQFAVTPETREGFPVYTNAPSATIRFVYDGDPRGYFGPYGEVEAHTNARGFRGSAFSTEKAPGKVRLAFLGDSFTFGEGVRDEDAYPALTAALLGPRFESLNFGVGGYNSAQSLLVLRSLAVAYAPDVVVLGYVPNDPEPPIFQVDPSTGRAVRRPSAVEDFSVAAPAGEGIYRSRLALLAWRAFAPLRATGLVEYYRALHDDASPGWAEVRRSLGEMGRLCRARGLPLFVVVFPLLHRLDDYPLAEVQRKVVAAAREAGAEVIDLLPLLRGQDGPSLWVHPTDAHPNERVHRVVATALAGAISNR